ncbi:hypothetical protein imdm_962 [gamma proteobacterium IMCC2047]|nr:hypothetical protein imdm_962 [gamma proteobacterium IMCC2047]
MDKKKSFLERLKDAYENMKKSWRFKQCLCNKPICFLLGTFFSAHASF